MRVRKTFEGDLVGTAEAQMLSVGTPVEGSAGYVAIDRVTGALHGRKGTFVLQHYGLTTTGTAELIVPVVPNSGTDDLTALAGTSTIHNAGAPHSYTFDHDL